MANARIVIEGIDRLRKELTELLATSSSEEGLLAARFNRWSNRTHTQLSDWGLGQDANLFSGTSHRIVGNDWRGNISRNAKAKDEILEALRDDMENHPGHYEPRLAPDDLPPVPASIPISLTEVDVKVISAVVENFLKSKQSMGRKPLHMLAKSSEVLERLTRWSILRGLDNNRYLPNALAFHYCGNIDSLLFAKQSVELVARVLKHLFEKCDEDNKQFTLAEIENQGIEMFGKVDPENIKGGLYLGNEFPEKIKLGLYLGNEFGLLAGFHGNTEHTEINSIAINERVIEIENPENLWDTVIKKQTERIRVQLAGGIYHGQPDLPELDAAFETQQSAKETSRQVSQKVFVVHGHDEGTRDAIARFLEQLGAR